MRLINKFLGAVSALTLIAGAAHAATVGQPVTIQESAITGALANQKVVDQLSGQYDEVVTVTPAGLTSGSFVTEAIFNAGNWFANSQPVGTQVNSDALLSGGAGYALYAKFSQKGTYSTDGVTFTFTGFAGGALELWADPLQNTNYDIKASATGDIANLNLASGAASITDDLLLGSASIVAQGAGSSTAGLANGNFEIIFSDFSLAKPAGENYFIAPRPFYMVLDLNGNFQAFAPGATPASFQLVNNSANAFFMKVPEPSGLGLVGLALVGLGFFSRRARK